jgi:acyl-CoA synthetase (AMP-forming)/AMP-acid ligase II/thioesterase domain-containing protein
VIRQIVHDRAQRFPEAPAILAPGGAAIDYRGLDSAVTRIGATLARIEASEGSCFALVCSNGPRMAVGFLGIAAHAACAPLNPACRQSEFELYLGDLRPRAVVVEAGLDSAVRAAAAAVKIPLLELTESVELDGAPGAGPERGLSPGPADVALLLHTSGTTARPKLVPLTQANLAASARHIAASLDLTAADRCLNVMPLFHIHGLEAALLASLVSGGSVVCSPGFSAAKFFDWIDEFRPTWYTAVPTVHQSALARAKLSGDRAARSSLRFIRSCSSPLPPSVAAELEEIFRVPVIEAYGMTEAAHQVTSNPLPPGARNPGSVGIAAGPELAVMDEAGHPLPRGAQGEIVIRGPNVTSGYADNSEANAAAFTGGWFRTGDVGHLDADGYLFLSGRRKEMINRGGEKVVPREVDEALLLHPGVAQAAAFAVPHPLLGETVAAAVVLKPSFEATEKDLRAFAGERLALFKVPEKIVFLEEIPKGPTGKIQRVGLAARLGIEELRPAPQSSFAAPRSEMEKRIAAIFAEALGVNRVGVLDGFFDLGGESLLAAALVARINQETGAGLSALEFILDPTVSGVCRKLDAPRNRSASDEPRVVIQGGQSGPALFCVPGSYGDLAGFVRLARSLGDTQPVSAFRLPEWECGYRIERLAERYLAEVFAAQPHGPYHLLGVCTGGFVAYEMARQIRAKGEEVGVLALLDCYNQAWAAQIGARERFGYRIDLVRKRILHQRGDLRRAGIFGAVRHLRGRFAALLETARQSWMERVQMLVFRAGLKLPARMHDPRLAIRHAAARYTPLPEPGRLELFRVEEPHVGGYDYPEMGWHGMAKDGIAIHEIPGAHLTMLSEPAVRVIAERLLAALREAAAVR